MIGGVADGLATAQERQERREQVEGKLHAFGRNRDNIIAIPVVHAGTKHGQGGLALDERVERQRAIIIVFGRLLHRVQVVMLVGQGVRQLMSDDRLVIVLVKLVALAEKSLEKRGPLVGLGLLGFLDQVHRLGLGIVKGGDFLGVHLGQRLLEVKIARYQSKGLQGQLVGAKLAGGHVLVDFLENERFHVFTFCYVSLDLVLERDLAQPRQQLFHRAFVADHGLGILT